MKHSFVTVTAAAVLGNVIYAHRKGIVKVIDGAVAGALKVALPKPSKSMDEEFLEMLKKVAADEQAKAEAEAEAEADEDNATMKPTPGKIIKFNDFRPFDADED